MSSYTEENNQAPEMQQNLELLQEIPFFSAFPIKALKLLAFLAERIRFSDGENVYEEGDTHDRAYLVLGGKLTLQKRSGTNTFAVHNFVAGDFMGSLSLLGSMTSLFNLTCEEDTTVLSITREQFAKILEQFPETNQLALKSLIKELHQWERRNLSQAEDCCLVQAGATVL